MAYPLSTSSTLPYVGVGKQSTLGTGVAPGVFVPYRAPVSLDAGQSADAIFEAGVGPYVTRHMKTEHNPSGSFGFGARPATLAELAAWFLGADAVSGAGPYLHTATPSQDVTLVSVEQCAGDANEIIERYVDSVLSSLTVVAELAQDVVATVGWEGGAPAWQTSRATPSYESGVNGTSPGANFRHSDGTYTIDGSAETNVQMFELSLEWRFDGVQLNRVTRARFVKLELAGSVKVRQLLDDTDTMNAYRKVNYGSSSGTIAAPEMFGTGALVAVFDNGLSAGNEREVTITIPQITWESATYTDLDPSGATMYVEREGRITKSSGSAFVTIATKTGDSGAY